MTQAALLSPVQYSSKPVPEWISVELNKAHVVTGEPFMLAEISGGTFLPGNQSVPLPPLRLSCYHCPMWLWKWGRSCTGKVIATSC